MTFSKIKKARIENINNVIIGNLNINSFPNKFQEIKVFVNEMLDILIITETKADDTFPVSQFHIDVFSKPYRLDKNINGGWCYYMCERRCSQQSFHKTCFTYWY